MPMPVSTWTEVDLDQFAHNLRQVRALAGPRCEVLLVVKADAYGHGAVTMAQAAVEEGVRHFGVATLHEGIEIRRGGVTAPVVVLSPLLPSEAGEAVAHDLAPTVCDLEFAEALSREAVACGRPARCHVEVDTGMGRIGVREEQAEDFLRKLVALPGLRLTSISTHFPDADAEDLAFAAGQVKRFRALARRLERAGLHAPRLHAANSAGLVNLPEARLDWVRVGLLAYGYLPGNARARPDVRPVMAFKTRLVQVRELPAGASISYGRTFVAPGPMRIGVVAVGYGHGYSWLLSGQGQMLVHGRRVPIVGRVTMDLTMVDLAAAPAAQVGDEVVLFGSQGDERLGVDEVAAWSRTLHYEIMCTIGKRVTRIYVRGGRPIRLTTLVGESEEWTHAAADHFRSREDALAAARKR
jgi:alanine racemase